MLFMMMRQTFGLHGISQMFPVCKAQLSYEFNEARSSLRCSDFCARHLAQVYGLVGVVGERKVAVAYSSDLHRLWGKLALGGSCDQLVFRVGFLFHPPYSSIFLNL
jgi:hypothetical protein